MIPSVLAQHVEQGIKDFLRTTFPVTTPFFSNILDNFLSEPGNVFKGPYLDIQLPFQQDKTGSDYFPDRNGTISRICNPAASSQRTIMDDTLPGGPIESTITYEVPFDHCDREKDYEIAWREFEKR